MFTKPTPSQERLREMLDYDPETGLLTWLFRPEHPEEWNTRWAGKPAFTSPTSDGYRQGRVDGNVYRAHRIIWKWLYNEEPPEIDHRNGVRSDNRKINLRASTKTENMRNHKMRNSNTSGICGVYWHKRAGKWMASIGDGHYIGLFNTIDEAAAARLSKQMELGYSERHGKRP